MALDYGTPASNVPIEPAMWRRFRQAKFCSRRRHEASDGGGASAARPALPEEPTPTKEMHNDN
jgi:hypothetical protein